MEWKRVHNQGGRRTFVLVFDRGDEVMHTLQDFAGRHAVRGAQFTAIGAFEQATVAFFDWPRRQYDYVSIDEQVEVLSLVGDVVQEDGEAALHAHVVVGKRDGTAHGGHLVEARVRPTLELVLVDSPAYLLRRHDPDSGLNLIHLS
jgi:predicted DNA-binding protein with PD1-like motif